MTLVMDWTPVARRRWLRLAAVEPGGVWRGRASLFTILDVAGAIAFAGGLALFLAAGSGWSSARVCGVGLMLGGALWRGGFARLAAGAGAEASIIVKARIRRRATGAALRTRAGVAGPLGETLAAVVDGVEALEGYAARFAPQDGAGRVTPLVIALAMAPASPVAALIVLTTFLPFVAAMALTGGAAAAAADGQMQALARLSGLFVDRLRALPVILAFEAETATAEALAVSAQTLAARTLAVLRIAFLSSAVLEFFAALSVALVAVYCGFNLLHLTPIHLPERLDLGRAVFVLALAPEAYLPLRRLAAAYHDRQAAEAAVPVLAPMTGEPPVSGRRLLARPPAIRFETVSVSYPGDPRPALNGFELDLKPGRSVALLGPSGSGKSTVLHLLLGLVSPSEGRILCDGATIAQAAPLAAFAGQAPMVVPGSVRDNILMVRRDAPIDEVVSAAERAGLLGTPQGLDRIIDERGGGLSGGERRRLGLARAFLSHAPLLLLDEPTADLDRNSEALLLPVIRQAMTGRTTLIATHSAAVAALADRVLRLGR
jgi:ATP-binding cassette subfamily C protein CydD